MEPRNKTISLAYLAMTNSFIASVGVEHFSGLQNELNNALSKNIAANRFAYIYIISDDEDERSLHELELPTEIIIVDGRKKTAEIIANELLQQLARKNILSKQNPSRSQQPQTAEQHLISDTLGFDTRNKSNPTLHHSLKRQGLFKNDKLQASSYQKEMTLSRENYRDFVCNTIINKSR